MHQEVMKGWEVETAKLKEAKVPKKNWPAKLKCACKNMVIAVIKLSELVEGFEDEGPELVLDASDSEDEKGDDD